MLRGKFTLEEPEWDEISHDAKDFVSKLLTFDPNDRISAEDALQHPWIKNTATKIKVDQQIAVKSLANLKNFKSQQSLKQAALAFIASQLTSKEETEDLEKIFKQIDENGDGQLSKDEILKGYSEATGIPISEEEVDKMFEEIDLDKNGTIDYTEFVMATMSDKQTMTNDKLQLAFKLFDKDGNGSIEADEIKAVLGDSKMTSE